MPTHFPQTGILILNLPFDHIWSFAESVIQKTNSQMLLCSTHKLLVTYYYIIFIIISDYSSTLYVGMAQNMVYQTFADYVDCLDTCIPFAVKCFILIIDNQKNFQYWLINRLIVPSPILHPKIHCRSFLK